MLETGYYQKRTVKGRSRNIVTKKLNILWTENVTHSVEKIINLINMKNQFAMSEIRM